MRIVINVKTSVEGNVFLVPRLDQSSGDTINEVNAGHALYAHLESEFGAMERKARPGYSAKIIAIMCFAAIVALGVAVCIASVWLKWMTAAN